MDYNFYSVKLSQLLFVVLINYDGMIDVVNIADFETIIKRLGLLH